MKTKAKKYIDANISYILKNAYYNNNNFLELCDYVLMRLIYLSKFDITKKQLMVDLQKHIKNANKIFLKEYKFQGCGEIGREYKKLHKIKSYSFQI